MFIFCFVAISLTAYSQNDTAFLNSSARLFSNYAASHPIEKVYLHLNKQHYNIGDTIWFKAYTVIGETHHLSALSGILYTELINDKDSVVKRITLKLSFGLSWSNLPILRGYKPGVYHLRAYTNWMRNAGAAYFYNQPLRIGGIPLSLSAGKQGKGRQPRCSVFPRRRYAGKWAAVKSSGKGCRNKWVRG